MNVDTLDESSGSIKRRQLFDLFSQNLNTVKKHPGVHMAPDFDEGYLCPICFKLFGRDALSTKYDDHLTLEDIPPQCLGGKVLALTCKICNNRAGSELESDLSKKLHADAFLARTPGIEMEARFSPDPSTELAATVRFMADDVVSVMYDPKRSHPDAVTRLHKLEETGRISEVTLEFQLGYRVGRPEVALLRIAYLLAFARFGYGFLMNPHLLPVRHQIQTPSEKLLPDFGVIKWDFPDSAVGIGVVYEPKELQSFLIVFDLNTQSEKVRYGVLLPGPTEPGLHVYEHIAELRQADNRLPIMHRIRMIPAGEYLQNPKLAYASLDYWKAFLEIAT